MKINAGNIIKELRLSKKMSQEDLITLTDMSKTFLSDIENDKKTPSLKTIFKIAKALKVHAWEIVKKIEESN